MFSVDIFIISYFPVIKLPSYLYLKKEKNIPESYILV